VLPRKRWSGGAGDAVQQGGLLAAVELRATRASRSPARTRRSNLQAATFARLSRAKLRSLTAKSSMRRPLVGDSPASFYGSVYERFAKRKRLSISKFWCCEVREDRFDLACTGVTVSYKGNKGVQTRKQGFALCKGVDEEANVERRGMGASPI
jgi:hypothetical protein